MSGSSLDGLDICYSRIDVENEKYTFEILEAKTIEYNNVWLENLRFARGLGELEIEKLSAEYGKIVAEFCNDFIANFSIYTSKLDFITSHGHTVYHYPERGITLQIGDGQTVANLTGFQTIANLRQADMDAGGQGAPIVPIGDLLFFSNYKYCLNLGGIMNISIKENGEIVSFDIGVCNQLINHYANLYNMPFDKDGCIAQRGNFSQFLFDKLNDLPYFSQKFPKSLDNGFTQNLIDICDSYDLSIEDKLHTFYHHIAFQIKNVVNNNMPILTTGGGAHNLFLIELMQKKFGLNIQIPSKKLIDYKEALIMSLIGLRKLERKYNVLASVTGASQNTICGELYQPN